MTSSLISLRYKDGHIRASPKVVWCLLNSFWSGWGMSGFRAVFEANLNYANSKARIGTKNILVTYYTGQGVKYRLL